MSGPIVCHAPSRARSVGRVAVVLGCAGLVACIDVPPPPASAPAQPYAVAGDLVVDDPLAEAVWYIEAAEGAEGAPRVERAAFAGARGASVDAADGSARFWLDDGGASGVGRVTRVGDAATGVASAGLGAPFTGLAACDDGVGVLAFHADGAAATTLVNTAEIALVDPIAATASGASAGAGVRRATVSGLSRAPYAGGCSTKIALADGDHRLVWVLARSAIGLLDVGAASATSAVVPLVAPGSNAAVMPKAAIAVAGTDGVDLYVIAGGSNDVLHLRVGLGGAAPAVSLDQIGVAGAPVALEIFASSAGLRAAALVASPPGVALVNPDTGASTFVSVALGADAWTLYDDPSGKRVAVAYGSSGKSSTVTRIDLDAVEKKKGKAVTSVLAELPISSVRPAGARLLLLHGGASAVSIYDAEAGKISPFKGTGKVLGSLVVDDVLYLLGETPSASAPARVSRIALTDLAGAALDLPRAAKALLPFGASGVAVSGDGLGGPWLAIWPTGMAAASDGSPAPSHWLEGFALAGALDAEVR